MITPTDNIIVSELRIVRIMELYLEKLEKLTTEERREFIITLSCLNKPMYELTEKGNPCKT